MILLSSSFAANGFVTWGFALTIIILFEAGGLTPAEAMLAAAVIGIAQWGGRVLDFFAGRYIPPLIMGLTGAALFPLSFFFLIANAGFSATMGFAVLYGVAGGITAVARATLGGPPPSRAPRCRWMCSRPALMRAPRHKWRCR
ncbi:hypothetical protein [Ketogulonicigenium vulgare]|uniref:hypothetical protein n=1 Tax=Ketogulonicigenium vulgare TaxID=92945 RepID=UPI00030C2129|nr:hypothetical protein [Ketogulonicigenium vulgare]